MRYLLPFVALLSLLRGVNAQTPANCSASTGFSWTFNSVSQSPCDVASSLGGVCNSGQFTIPAINSSQFYSGPTSETANDCRCSTVYYSLLSACGECQGATIITWSSYSTNCSTVFTGIFPENIPSGTEVPHWAYLDVVTGNAFNATLAEQAGDLPETSGGPSATVSTTPSSPASSSSSSASTSTSGAPANGSTSNSHAGAIAGGVVGGVVSVALLAGLIFWFLRRRRTQATTGPRADLSNHLTHDMTGASAPTIIGSAFTPPPMAQKLYDPSDPSTYPTTATSPGPSQSFYRRGSFDMNSSVYTTNPAPATHHTYTGVAEI